MKNAMPPKPFTKSPSSPLLQTEDISEVENNQAVQASQHTPKRNDPTTKTGISFSVIHRIFFPFSFSTNLDLENTQAVLIKKLSTDNTLS